MNGSMCGLSNKRWDKKWCDIYELCTYEMIKRWIKDTIGVLHT